jgi:hypothetical protein
VTLSDTILFVGCLFVFIIVCLFFKSLVSTQTWATRSTGSTWNNDHTANYILNCFINFIFQGIYVPHTLWILQFFIFRTLVFHICSSVELRELCKIVESLNMTIMLLWMQILWVIKKIGNSYNNRLFYHNCNN